MAHESFEDPEVAALMNEIFINIKVDREERPDLDNIYMTVCQLITGSGGWPLTIIMDADKRPFTAGTYFPKKSRFGRIGMLELIPRIKQFWEHNREQLYRASAEVLEQLQSALEPGEGLPPEILDEAFREALLLYDHVYGGFKGAPKFPTPHKLWFLLRYWKRTGDQRALAMVEKTLQAMRFGGIYDHIGFGFHRYSTDSQWLVPHFEKMLYDQALLMIAYTEAYQATKNPLYRQVVYEIATYVLRDLKAPNGGFYSAEDADSEGEEGKFYTWTLGELQAALGEEASFFAEIYNIKKEGNFNVEITGQKDGRNITHLLKKYSTLAKEHSLSEEEIREKINALRERLFHQRNQRIHPHKDDKILTDWNGLMIAAFSIAARAFDDQEFKTVAKIAADFLLQTMKTDEGRLYHRFRDGEAAITGLVNDYSYVIFGLLELYQTVFDPKYLREAITLNEQFLTYFWDTKTGGFFFTPEDGEKLIVRKKEIYDGALPSGNAVAMLNLLHLTRITGDLTLEEKALQIMKTFTMNIEMALLAHSMSLCALEYVYGSTYEIVISGSRNAKETTAMFQAVNTIYLPNKIILFVPKGFEDELSQITDFIQGKGMKEDKATAYVCINRFCKFPTTDIKKMLEFLE